MVRCYRHDECVLVRALTLMHLIVILFSFFVTIYSKVDGSCNQKVTNACKCCDIECAVSRFVWVRFMYSYSACTSTCKLTHLLQGIFGSSHGAANSMTSDVGLHDTDCPAHALDTCFVNVQPKVYPVTHSYSYYASFFLISGLPGVYSMFFS